MGGRHSTEEAFALPTQPSRVRFSAPLSEWTAKINRKWDRTKKNFKNIAFRLMITQQPRVWILTLPIIWKFSSSPLRGTTGLSTASNSITIELFKNRNVPSFHNSFVKKSQHDQDVAMQNCFHLMALFNFVCLGKRRRRRRQQRRTSHWKINSIISAALKEPQVAENQF